VLEPTDTIEALEDYDNQIGNWLDFISTYPEFVVIIGDDDIYLLALAISADSGTGGYLQMPTSHHSRYKTDCNLMLTTTKDIIVNSII